jgi:phytoene dehydrogenase-like protein
VREADPFDPRAPAGSGRAFLREQLSDEELVEALLLPLLWYGSAREDDIDAYQAIVLFRSIFLEGLARPAGGIKTLLDLLVARLEVEGGELRLRAGVAEIVRDGHGAARGVRLDSGEELASDCVLSSAGYAATRSLCGLASAHEDQGRLSFVETQHVLARPSAEIGAPRTLVFFATSARPAWRRPAGLIDVASGVICCSDNYAPNEILPSGLMRITCLANPDAWRALDQQGYAEAKRCANDALAAAAAPFAADPRPHSVLSDCFTPRTIERFTGHAGGAVYGSPHKRREGELGVPGVHLIGTDQGLVGVVGALMSGVTMANRHVLLPS